MSKKLLIVILVIALIFEAGLTGMCFFAPVATLKNVGSGYTPDTMMLGYIIAWFCLFVSLVCALALWQVVRDKEGYATLCYILGLWWIGIGLGIYFVFKKPDNLLTDTLKGAILVAFTIWDQGNKKKQLIHTGKV